MTTPLTERELDLLKNLVLRYEPESWMVDSESPDRVIVAGREEWIATASTGYRRWHADAIVQFAHAVPRLLRMLDNARSLDDFT